MSRLHRCERVDACPPEELIPIMHDPIRPQIVHRAACRCPRCTPPGPALRARPHPSVYALLGFPLATAIAAAISPGGTLAALLAIVGR